MTRDNDKDITVSQAIELIETLLDNTARDYLQAVCAGEWDIAIQYMINQQTIMARLANVKGWAYASRAISRVYREALSGNLPALDEENLS